ncbi:hypothetical protein HNP84_006986 [Thermocatellispora tengchongensis]|uniref:DUF4190 domain-containing protein n=1 Tax=Thermocatellispora tengchongensis TaxID=1073253 RepID=A0A840P7B2_9ACTN|nr:hypothetical protein [Thermocatellispora tengchongensis]MBB5137234.1 hypothetical protein [Thermocatellispora tengchongensis]
MQSHVGQIPAYSSVHGAVPVSNNFAVAAFIQSIFGLVCALLVPVLGFVLGVMACIFGGLGMSRANKVGKGQGLAITAIVLGPIAIIGSVGSFFVWASINS